MDQKADNAWKEAQRLCRLSDEEVHMAKELGFQPRSLIKNIPAPSQMWKAPVNEWVRTIYEEKFGARRQVRPVSKTPSTRGPVIEFRNAEYPWPDRPEIPAVIVDDIELDFDSEEGYFEPPPKRPTDDDIDKQNGSMLRRQCLFRWAAQSVAIALSKLPAVEKVAAFGAVAGPLKMEVPRFRQFRRYRTEVLHECTEVDLAVWTTDPSRLKELKRAMNSGRSAVENTPYGGVAHHQIDIHVFDAARENYQGRLCIYGQCPKGKRDCLVPGCGAQPFLRQFYDYRFDPARFEAEPKVILFDRAGGFLVKPPRIEAKPPIYVHRSIDDGDDENADEDVPF